MDLFSLDDGENKLRAQLVKERNRRYQAEEKLKEGGDDPKGLSWCKVPGEDQEEQGVRRVMLTVAELITILQKSGLKVPKKFKLVYEDQDQEQGGKEKKKSKRSNDDHLAALAEADLAAGVSGDEGTNSDFDEENFEMWIEESDIKIQQALEETKKKRKQLKGEGETDVEEGKEKEVVGRREKELEAEILRMKAEQKSLEEKLTEKCKDLETCNQKIKSQNEEIEFLSTKLEKICQIFEERTKKLKSLLLMNKELASLDVLCTNLETENRNLHVELELKEAQIIKLSDANQDVDTTLSNKDQEISDLKQTVKLKDETIEKMATASMKLKSRLARFEQELCRFTVEKVFKGFPPSMAQLSIIQETKTKAAHLHVIVNGKRNAWSTDDILNFANSKTEANKFYIIFKDKTQEAFLSNVRDEVLYTLQEVLKSLREARR